MFNFEIGRINVLTHAVRSQCGTQRNRPVFVGTSLTKVRKFGQEKVRKVRKSDPLLAVDTLECRLTYLKIVQIQ